MTTLKRLRLLCGLRQTDVFIATGIPVIRLSRAEQGRSQLSPGEFRLVVDYLRDRLSALLPHDTKAGNRRDAGG